MAEPSRGMGRGLAALLTPSAAQGGPGDRDLRQLPVDERQLPGGEHEVPARDGGHVRSGGCGHGRQHEPQLGEAVGDGHQASAFSRFR